MTPADKVIEVFGGIRAVAKLVGRNPSSIQRWKKPRSERGTGGAVPTACQGRLLAIARERGITLTADDLIMTTDTRNHVV
ncbi:MAG: carph-isopro domain-containing protein [Betaproteobacteria bacterium]|jgi:hypothetical protein